MLRKFKKKKKTINFDYHKKKDLGQDCGKWDYDKIFIEISKRLESKSRQFENYRIPFPEQELKKQIYDNLQYDLLTKDKRKKIYVEVRESNGNIWINYPGILPGSEMFFEKEEAAMDKWHLAKRKKHEIYLTERKNSFDEKIKLFEEKIREWENEKNLPSDLWLDVNQSDIEKMKKRNPVSDVSQVYILKLEKWIENHEIYIGMTGKGYPSRIKDHAENGKNSKYHHLAYKNEKFQQGVLQTTMDLLNPLQKKFFCSHWLEWWVQQTMKNIGFNIPYGMEKRPYDKLSIDNRKTECEDCKIYCEKLSKEYGDDKFNLDNF